MKRIALRALCLFLILSGAAKYSPTQVIVGTPSFGSFGGGPFDNVNLGNLNVNFKIPVRHKAGRGIPFVYDLTYDNSVWKPVLVGNQLKWLPVSTSSYWGWQGLNASAATPGTLTYATTITFGTCGQMGQNHWTQWQYNNYVYTDEFGGHAFPYTNYYVQADNATGCPPNGPQPTTTPGIPASDGSGLTLYATPGQGSVSSYEVTRTGTTLGALASTDANGNQITLSSGTYTDTLGQTPLIVAGSPPSNTTLTYVAPSGANASYTASYKSYTVQTNFGCAVGEYNVPNIYLVDKITLPDGSSYQFAYEPTPANPGNVTGRLASVTLPTGGSVSYTYTGGNNGIVCADGSTAGMTRVLNPVTLGQPSSTWNYSRAGSGNSWTTTVIDPQSNNTVISFSKDSALASTSNFYETQRVVNQGPSTPLLTTLTCYNNNFASCAGASVSSPITQTDSYTQWPGGKTSLSEAIYNTYGLATTRSKYNYGVTTGAPPSSSVLLSNTAISYANTLGNIVDHPSSIVTTDSAGDILSKTTFNYDEYSTYPLQPTTGTPSHVSVSGSRGNATTVTNYSTSSSTLVQHFSYFDTGNVYQSTDVNNAVTTYVFGAGSQGNSTVSCGNSFPTSINFPVNSLSTSTAWNCYGGVATQRTDANLQVSKINYTDPSFWRPASSQDPLLNTTNYNYTPTSTESSMVFNSSLSVAERLATVDGLGRVVLSQGQQGVGSTNYDSTETNYDTTGHPYQVTMPYAGTKGQTTSSTPKTTTTFDALNRALQRTDGGGGTVAYTYNQNDILQTLGPAPTGENAKKKQLEYDGLGRLISVCEITQGTGYVACNQSNSVNGYMTTYVYDFSGGYNRVTVTQNAQTTPVQTRVYLYDLLGRLVSETNPENATTTYAFDSVSGCSGTFNGDLVKRSDAKGNATCYAYDGIHRVTSASYTGPYTTPTKNFVYDTATVNNVVMGNAKGRLAEAYTGTSGSKITDLGFVYSARGEVIEVWESTPHSGGYYHPTTAYWANGKLNHMWMSGLPNISYGADSEGRMSTVSADSGQNPVTATTYATSGTAQPIGSLTQVTYGSGDSDSFSYDTNTGRVTQFKYTVSTSSEIGNLGWNQNGTLASLGITDPFNSPDTQNCTYVHDDLQRLQKANCGTTWGQSFGFDVFGNITKSVLAGSTGISWQPTYTHGTTNTNQYFSLPGFTPTYDANGNLLTDSFHTYTWDAEGKMMSLDSTTLTYDALGRMVEQNQSGTYFQIVYSPIGKKLAIMKAQVIQQAFVPLPGKAKAEYLSWGLSHYRHPDWLGSARLESTTAHAIVQSVAYDAFGVPYAQKSGGNGELSFTEQNKDTAWLQYDFLDRQYDPTQGRWLSPDRAGLSAVDPTSPQSWNRYAYVQNNPLAMIDPFGDDCYDPNGNKVGGAGGVSQAICDSLTTGAYSWLGTLPPGIGVQSTTGNGTGLQYVNSLNGETLSNEGAHELGLLTSLPSYNGIPLTTGNTSGGAYGPGTSSSAANNEVPIVEEPGTPGPNIDEQILNSRANALAQAINKTGVQTIANPCFWVGAAVVSTTVGAFGAAGANFGEILSAASENYPTILGKISNWIYRKAANPGPVGAVGAGIRQIGGSINSACAAQ